jgi:hypothetical protein
MITRCVLIQLVLVALLLQGASAVAWAQVDSGGRGGAAAERFRNAGPEERRRIRQEIRSRYEKAGPEERERMERRLEQMRRRLRDERMQGDGVARGRFQRYRRESEKAPGGSLDRRPLPFEERRRTGGQLREMSPGERAQLRQQLRTLPTDEREVLEQRIRDFRSMNPDEQAELRKRLDSLLELPDEERARVRSNAKRWGSMSTEQRAHMRSQMQRLRALSAEERMELLDRALEDHDATSARRSEE